MFLVLSEEKRYEYFNHWIVEMYICQRSTLNKIMPARKAAEIKETVIFSEDFWEAFLPYGIEHVTPEEIARDYLRFYESMMELFTKQVEAVADGL